MKEEGYINDEMNDNEKSEISLKYLQKEVVNLFLINLNDPFNSLPSDLSHWNLEFHKIKTATIHYIFVTKN